MPGVRIPVAVPLLRLALAASTLARDSRCPQPRARWRFFRSSRWRCSPARSLRVRAEAGAARRRRVAQDPRSPDECASARGRAGGQAAPAQAGGACGQALGAQASLRVAQAARALPQGPPRDPGEEGPAAAPCLEPAHGARTRGDERQPRAARQAGDAALWRRREAEQAGVGPLQDPQERREWDAPARPAPGAALREPRGRRAHVDEARAAEDGLTGARGHARNPDGQRDPRRPGRRGSRRGRHERDLVHDPAGRCLPEPAGGGGPGRARAGSRARFASPPFRLDPAAYRRAGKVPGRSGRRKDPRTVARHHPRQPARPGRPVRRAEEDAEGPELGRRDDHVRGRVAQLQRPARLALGAAAAEAGRVRCSTGRSCAAIRRL